MSRRSKVLIKKAASETVVQAAPGRPIVLTVAQRRQKILECAEAEFFEQGYGNTQMGQIAARAGMSKKTLYQIFSNKESVLTAFLRGYEQDPPLSHLPPAGTYDPIEELKTALVDVAAYVLRPRQIAVSRLVIAEARKSPEISAQFFKAEITEVRKMLAERISILQAAGILANRDPAVVSDISLSAVIGHEHFGRLIGTNQHASLNRADLSERADEIVSLYCR